MFSMFLIAIMLLIAIFPTAGFQWYDEDFNPSPGQPAICYFGNNVDTSSPNFDGMVMSLLLLALSFTTRTVRLYKTFSLRTKSARRFLSSKYGMLLGRIHDWCNVQAQPHDLKLTLIYRPFLALFLVLRGGMDVYSSMFMEVKDSYHCARVACR
jgi:hypothetical protein